VRSWFFSARRRSWGRNSGAEKELINEWKKKTGYARMDLQNIQILPDFHMTRDYDAEGTIPRGTPITVRQVDVDEQRRCIDLDVSQANPKLWTEVHLVLDKPIGSTLSDEQKAQLNAMWARLISEEPVDGAATKDDAPAGGSNPAAGATVHIYRAKHVAGSAVNHPVTCDWLHIATLASGRYFTLVLPPGPHECFALAFVDKKVSLSLEAGHEYYVQDVLAWSGAFLKEMTAEDGTAAIRELEYAELESIRDRRDVRTEEAK
jgi:hypothetical protein